MVGVGRLLPPEGAPSFRKLSGLMVGDGPFSRTPLRSGPIFCASGRDRIVCRDLGATNKQQSWFGSPLLVQELLAGLFQQFRLLHCQFRVL